MFNPQLSSRGELIHLLSTEGLPKRLLEPLLAAACAEPPALAGRSICFINLDQDHEIVRAAAAAGARVSHVQVEPGQTLPDADLHVLRHAASGAAHVLAAQAAHVVNAGDGCHAEPLAALADLLTIQAAKGGFTELRVALVGGLNARGRSVVHALTTLGAPELRLVAPRPMQPEGLSRLGLLAYGEIASGLRDADVIIDLGHAPESMVPLADYLQRYALTPDRLAAAQADALVIRAPASVARVALTVFAQLLQGQP